MNSAVQEKRGGGACDRWTSNGKNVKKIRAEEGEGGEKPFTTPNDNGKELN